MPDTTPLRRRTAVAALALLAVACSSEDPGNAVRRQLAPTDTALRSLELVAGTARCLPGNGLESAPLCWTSTLGEPELAGKVAAALRAAGALDVEPVCALIGSSRQVRCEIAGAWKGNALDISVVHQGTLIQVVGYGSPAGVPHLVDGHSPVPVPS